MSKTKAHRAYRLVDTGEEGSSHLEISTHALPLPTTKFTANAFGHEVHADTALFLFGQSVYGRLTAVVGISLSLAELETLQGTFNSRFRQTVAGLADSYEGSVSKIGEKEMADLPSDRCLIKSANFGSVEVFGGTGVMAWYQIPARAIRALKHNLDVHVDDPTAIIEIRGGVLLVSEFIGTVDAILREWKGDGDA